MVTSQGKPKFPQRNSEQDYFRGPLKRTVIYPALDVRSFTKRIFLRLKPKWWINDGGERIQMGVCVCVFIYVSDIYVYMFYFPPKTNPNSNKIMYSFYLCLLRRCKSLFFLWTGVTEEARVLQVVSDDILTSPTR